MIRLILSSVLVASGVAGPAAAAIDIGSRLELFVDDYLIEAMSGGAELRLHEPIAREIVLVHDAPWEGAGCGYNAVFRDGDIFRMYYKAWNLHPTPGKLEIPHDTFGAYAESEDGVHWTKPSLGLFEFEGSKDNNIVWMDKGSHDFTPFKDANPACLAGEEYKAIAYGDDPKGAYAFKSSDGIHWSFLQEAPILTDGAFDTQNLAFWDELRGEYRAYIRDFEDGVRIIKTATSKDFRTWGALVKLEYPGAPTEALYTNQVKPYYRAPHIYMGFPTRYNERGWSPSMEALPNVEHRKMRSSCSDRYGMAITDGLFMTSRDGVTFKRWGEAFLRPGLRTRDNWTYGDNYIAWHVVETPSAIEDAPPELSLYATESYWTDDESRLRRFTIRMDGFVSVHAPLSGGEFTTKPLLFTGKDLVLNFSTSAAGSIRIEIQQADGTPIDGFRLEDAPEIFGDSLDRVVPWKDDRDLSALAGAPVRLRFVMSDADLYAMRFRE
ncbi:MAG TPA: hypothetical protein PLO37_07145 [Candidatus Hydrogenedentes bacterium]|nr:hypothetical protein [Candidatus Hydrogenedentota bacterium]HPG66607.1 hypothetical protein [Candidatus Hydrogenedentota bacterium]